MVLVAQYRVPSLIAAVGVPFLFGALPKSLRYCLDIVVFDAHGFVSEQARPRHARVMH